MKSKCTCLHLQAYDHMTTMDDNLEEKWCTCLRRQTTNDAHFWANKHQMNFDAHVWDAKWCTCLRRQTPNDTHVWDDKHQMTHMFETTGFDTTNITVKKFNSTITTKTLQNYVYEQIRTVILKH